MAEARRPLPQLGILLSDSASDPSVDPAGCALDDLEAATRHMEDLDIFVGQRSRMHPGPGWATALAMVRRNLAQLRAELANRKGLPKSPA